MTLPDPIQEHTTITYVLPKYELIPLGFCGQCEFWNHPTPFSGKCEHELNVWPEQSSFAEGEFSLCHVPADFQCRYWEQKKEEIV